MGIVPELQGIDFCQLSPVPKTFSGPVEAIGESYWDCVLGPPDSGSSPFSRDVVVRTLRFKNLELAARKCFLGTPTKKNPKYLES